LLDQVRERIRYMHYSLRTEEAYVYWARAFIRFHELRHPKEMGCREVEAFLMHLATEKRVAPSTHKQALAGILFLYRQVLAIDLPWMQEIGRPKSRERIPVVLSREEVAGLLWELAARIPPAPHESNTEHGIYPGQQCAFRGNADFSFGCDVCLLVRVK
jgi:site-specific recombinase XerD